jgi:hypothetical protein
MFYIKFNGGLPCRISEEYPKDEKFGRENGWISSRDFETRKDADTVATYLTSMTGETYLGVDEGPGVSPRYRVIKAPKVGDFVSKSFNGDSYPVGTITKISPTWIVTTDVGKKFRRWKETGGWREQGRGFWMVKGHHDERNPHF